MNGKERKKAKGNDHRENRRTERMEAIDIGREEERSGRCIK